MFAVLGGLFLLIGSIDLQADAIVPAIPASGSTPATAPATAPASDPATAAPQAVAPVALPAPVELIQLTKPFPGTTWKFFSGKKDAKLEETWSIRADPETSKPLLICTGSPPGYLFTQQGFENFELELEWRYPTDANGNSGILLFINGEDHLWPTSVQVQLFQPEAGATFPHGTAQTDNVLQKVPVVSKPVNQWNRCQVLCKSGTLTVTVNGQKIGEVTGCRPRAGGIGLQSEGAVVHFRNFLIRELPPTLDPADVKPETKPDAGEPANKGTDPSVAPETGQSPISDSRK